AKRRPKLAALRETNQDFTDNYQSLEKIFFRFYPQMMDSVTKPFTGQ
ncbi:DUF479 domain-containing protein, partial [Salmonella enterica subsp. enterica serovar Eastbourne]|nr:DUF479 domain-containing protein [Salmonella enterica subsp. enterica serovar Eastbourne]